MSEFPLPQLGDVVLCRKALGSSAEIHPAVIVGVGQELSGVVVRVCIVTSRVSRVCLGDMEISPSNPQEFEASGLRLHSKVKTREVFEMPYDRQHFVVPKSGRFGGSPKIGYLVPSALLRLARAAQSIR